MRREVDRVDDVVWIGFVTAVVARFQDAKNPSFLIETRKGLESKECSTLASLHMCFKCVV